MLTAFILISVHLARAQQPKKVPRIGYLATRSQPGANEKAFLQGLQSLGYIEGQTIAIEWRFAQEKFDPLPELASELVRLKVDVIVTSGGYPTVSSSPESDHHHSHRNDECKRRCWVRAGCQSGAPRWKHHRAI